MPASDLVSLSGLMDDAKCFALVRQHRWPEGCALPRMRSFLGQLGRVRRHAAASSALPLQGVRVPLRRSHRHGAGRASPAAAGVGAVPLLHGAEPLEPQIAGELGLAVSAVQAMTEQLRRGLVAKVPAVELKGEVEIDEVYVVAGHKGQPEEVAKRGGLDGAAGWQARRAAARWEGQTNHPRPDPARRPGRAAHAGQRAAENA